MRLIHSSPEKTTEDRLASSAAVRSAIGTVEISCPRTLLLDPMIWVCR